MIRLTISKDSERLRISSTLRKDLYKGLQQYSSETDIPISKLLDRAIELYFKEVGFNIHELKEV